MSKIYDQLKGGDLRSTGNADLVADKAARDPSLVKDLVAGLRMEDGVIRMRCADALEKATRARPDYLQKYSSDLLDLLLSPGQPKEILWHWVLLMPRIKWSNVNIDSVYTAIKNCLSNSSSIVKTNTLQGLVDLSRQVPGRKNEITAILSDVSHTGTPAMRARAKKLLEEISD